MHDKLNIVLICMATLCTIQAQSTRKIQLSVGTSRFVATTYDNTVANAFLELLPISISMNELNGNEKYYFLSVNLPTNASVPEIIHSGDLLLWGQNCLVLFYETFLTTYSYSKIGFVEDATELQAALGSGNPMIKFELLQSTDDATVHFDFTEYCITDDGVLQFDGSVSAITLIDLSGRVVKSNESDKLNIHSISKGFYILKAESNGRFKTFKVNL